MALTKVSRGLLSTGIVDNSTTTAITIDSSENVGIGVVPTSRLHLKVAGNTYAGGIQIEDADSLTKSAITHINSSLYISAAGTNDDLIIDSSGNVGIGQAPSAFSNWKILELKGGTAGAMLNFENSSSTRVSSLAYDDGSDSLRIQNFLANPITFETSNTERMRILANGTISLGSVTTHNATILLTMGGNGTHHQHRWNVGPHFTSDNPAFYTINEAGTGVYIPHGNTSWSAHSDERIKENITPLGIVLPDVMNMRCVKYNLKSGDPSQTKIGFIAQDWQSSFPEVVDEDQNTVIESDGTTSPIEQSESTDVVKAIAYTETIPVLLKAIQEQQATIEALTQRIQTLENN